MDVTLSRSMFIIEIEKIYPSSFPNSTPKIDLEGLREMPYFRQWMNTSLKWEKWPSLFLENTIKLAK